MNGPRRSLLAAAALATLSTFAASSRADLPPEDGTRNVGYSFSVRGLAKAPDRVIVAYPCGTSNGAPDNVLVRLEEGRSVPVGRRGGECALFSLSREDYEAEAKALEGGDADKARLDALVAKGKRCDGGPTPDHILPKDDTRGEIAEVLEVKALSATECVVASVSGRASTTSAGSPRGSCGRACGTTTRGPGGTAGWLAGLAAIGMALGRRLTSAARTSRPSSARPRSSSAGSAS